jgi:prevent-host-death family protein
VACGAESGTFCGTMANVLSVTDLKRATSALVDRVHESGDAVIITQNGQAKAVLQDVRAYEETRKTLAMLKLVAQSEADIARGATFSQAEAKARVRRARR